MDALWSDAEKIKQGAILYVEDSADDQMIFEMAVGEAGIHNKLILFNDGLEALSFLRENGETPFMIISDVNMPKMDGFTLKAEIEKDEKLSLKCIPFVYLSSSAARKDVAAAFYHQAQGYFEKPPSIDGLVRILNLVKDYWTTSRLPGYY